MNGHEAILNHLEEVAKQYEAHLSVSILEDAPFIVEVGALTVTTNEEKQIVLQNTHWPTQFTQKAVDTILSCKFQDMHGNPVTPIVYSRVRWYKTQLESIKQTLKLFRG